MEATTQSRLLPTMYREAADGAGQTVFKDEVEGVLNRAGEYALQILEHSSEARGEQSSGGQVHVHHHHSGGWFWAPREVHHHHWGVGTAAAAAPAAAGGKKKKQGNSNAINAGVAVVALAVTAWVVAKLGESVSEWGSLDRQLAQVESENEQMRGYAESHYTHPHALKIHRIVVAERGLLMQQMAEAKRSTLAKTALGVSLLCAAGATWSSGYDSRYATLGFSVAVLSTLAWAFVANNGQPKAEKQMQANAIWRDVNALKALKPEDVIKVAVC